MRATIDKACGNLESDERAETVTKQRVGLSSAGCSSARAFGEAMRIRHQGLVHARTAARPLHRLNIDPRGKKSTPPRIGGCASAGIGRQNNRADSARLPMTSTRHFLP